MGTQLEAEKTFAPVRVEPWAAATGSVPRLRANEVDAHFGAAVGVCDVFLLLGSFLLAYWIRFHSGLIPPVVDFIPRLNRYLPLFASATVLCFAVLALLGSYSAETRGRGLLPGLLISYGGLLTLVFAFRQGLAYSRTTLFLAFCFQAVTMKLARVGLERARRVMRKKVPPLPVLVAGNEATIREARDALSAQDDYHLAATIETGEYEDIDRLRERVEGALQQHGCPGSWLVVGGLNAPGEFLDELLLECEKRLMELRLAVNSRLVAEVELETATVRGLAMLRPRRLPLDLLPNRIVKRGLDIAGALTGLALGGPVAFLSALLVRIESKGPLFYSQRRCGRDGRPFRLYKVRTMKPDAESECGPVWTTENDPRCTRVGKFLRRTCIDEIPQFWNVLKGEMSLVGPRPERPHFVSKFREEVQHYMTRHRVKPGLSGWAQVNGLRGNTSLQKRLEYDLHYLTHWSLGFEIKILLLTFWSVLRGHNAY